MSTPATAPVGRRAQIAQAYRITKREYPRIGLLLLSIFVGVGLVAGFAGWVWVHPAAGVMFGVLTGLLAVIVVFGRRVEKAAYAQVEGRPGAAASALQMLRRGWDVKPGIAFTKNQDVVHRVIGRPGIVLVGEGNPSRVRNLLAVERKKHARLAQDAPIHELVAGDDEGAIAIPKLTKHVQKLPKAITPGDMTDLLQRMRALDAMRPQAPIPHGPMPTSAKGMRKLMQGR
ncbi:DUF4191 domain-containing protein [soil metagenome]